MREKTLQDMKIIDELAEEAGGYVSPLFKNNTHYDYRRLLDYCKGRCIDPLDLTLRELQDFAIVEPMAI